ncbi:MAG: hypothetical protein IM466_07090 [Microcystis sp. M04BS1]|jgi:hypothetical protein|nr:hypothetical protein [Microcystis sp. M04BS1]NCS26957.1 hypothetical protein [Microcystis aeruginosa BS13-02]
MAYNTFTLELVKSQFSLTIINDRFCDALPTVEPQPEFTIVFNDLLELAEGARTEKAKSELLVTPILAQAIKLSGGKVKLFSGEEFNVDQEKGLNGFCDFLFSRSANPYTIDAPVFMLVEAKRGEIEFGLGQCVAEMIAAQLYNQSQGQTIAVVYGCVTSGRLWQFLKLQGDKVTIDPNNYPLTPIHKILGILKSILS